MTDTENKLIVALHNLLACAELNQDELEPETVDRIEEAEEAMAGAGAPRLPSETDPGYSAYKPGEAPAAIYKGSEGDCTEEQINARIAHLWSLRVPGPVDLGPEDNARDVDGLFAELARLEALA